MKVTAFMGSPRLNGNTAKLVDTILEGVAETGGKTERIDIVKLKIHPCIACKQCKENRGCVHLDDFPLIVDKIKESDIIVFGTPIYWWGPTAQFKTFLDRFYGIMHREFFKDKYILLVTPFESKDRKTSDYTVGMIKKSVEWIGVRGFESFSISGVAEKDDAANRNGLLKKAHELGKSIVMRSQRKYEVKFKMRFI